MKKFTYLSILLFALTMVSCSDTNVLVPSVTSGNQDWQLTHYYSPIVDIINSLGTDKLTPNLTFTTDESKNELILKHKFSSPSNAEWDIPNVITTNNGKNLEITLIQNRVNSGLSGYYKPAESRHYIRYSQKGKGSGAKIDVVVRYVYTDPSAGRNDVQNFTLNF